MDQRSIIWTQRSNRSTDPHMLNRPTPRVFALPRPPRATRPTPCCPTDTVSPNPASPDRPHAAQPRVARPNATRPTPPPSASVASCYASRRPTIGKCPCLLPSPLPPAPLPPPPHVSPPVSAASSCAQRLSRQRPCLLRPCASQNDRGKYKMTEEITK
jgi:hypothetical protein